MIGADTSCIVLAGGLGTRLRGAIGDIPKCMAPVAGKPFLHYLLSYLERQGVTELVFSLGYRAETVMQWLESSPPPFSIRTVVESEPLGTGGGIALALEACSADMAFVVNGDTFFDVNLSGMRDAHLETRAETTLALKHLERFDRYGTVQLAGNSSLKVQRFQEKQPTQAGLINGGIYCINREAFLQRPLPIKFSFEKDYLEAFVGDGLFSGYQGEGYFIDIGVPADYERAQRDFPTFFTA